MTEGERPIEAKDVFGDTCVLFNYAVNRRENARILFEDRAQVEKVASPRIKREFESVANRQQDIHRELLKFTTSGLLEEYEPEEIGSQKNDLKYAVELYSDLTALDDKVEVVRRLNELVNRLEKAKDELFGKDGHVTIVEVNGLDARLKGLLSGVVSNEADVRVLCDAVGWRRDGGSGTFLSEDAEDILGKRNEQTRANPGPGEEMDGEGTDRLSDSFEDFFAIEEMSLPERINEQIARRYDSESTLTILSVRAFLNQSAPLEEASE